MKYFSKFILIAFSLSLLFLGSCKKKKSFSDIPELKFMEIKMNSGYIPLGTDSLGAIRFSFTDGDGDIGVYGGDTSVNLFLKYFEKQNGAFVEIIPPQSQNARIPDLMPIGQNKTLEGEMEVGFFANPFSVFDTVKYEVYIVDRAMHKSNVITTPEIKVPH